MKPKAAQAEGMRAVRDTTQPLKDRLHTETNTALPQHAWPWWRYAQCKKLVTQGQTMSAFTCVRWWCSVTGRKQSGGFQGLLAGRWRPRAPGWARWGALYGCMRRQQQEVWKQQCKWPVHSARLKYWKCMSGTHHPLDRHWQPLYKGWHSQRAVQKLKAQSIPGASHVI